MSPQRVRIIWITLAILVVGTLIALLTYPLLFGVKAAPTWFVRPDGGTRWSVNHPEGQCDGKGDNAYSGTGTNQHCAFNDYRWLYDDTSFPGTNTWVIAGGDVVIIRGCAGPASPACRIGSDLQAGSSWCPGIGNGGCYNPAIPSGTAAQHTQILGANYAACTSNSAKQEMFGGWGLGVALNLTATQYVDISCINLTRHSQCIFFGSPANPPGCNRNFPNEDDYADNGIATSNTTAELNLTDVWVHGFLSRGVIGAIGGRVTCLRCNIDTNGGAGWDFDDGSSTAMGPGALWEFLYSTIQWSGCNQQYPAVDPIPVASCYSQSTGGYGDAVGSPVGTGLSMNIAHSTFVYNTQDALDGGHVDTGGPYTLSVTDSFFAHNGGSNSPKFDHKFGTLASPAVVTGNVMIGDGARMAAPIPGVPLSFNVNVSDFCRAGDTFPLNFDTNSAVVIGNNTVITYCPVIVDNSCNAGGAGCATAKSQIFNNIFIGYAFLGAPCGGGYPACAPGYASYPPLDYGGTNIGPSMYFYQSGGPGIRDYRNNIYYGTRQTCPTGFDNGVCGNPMLTGQPSGTGSTFTADELDIFGGATPNQAALQLATGSPAIGTGISYAQIPPADIFGNGVGSPPNVGAVYAGGGAIPPTLTSITVTPNPGSVRKGSTITMTCIAGYSDTSTGTCVSPTWNGTAAHSSVNAGTGVVTGTSVGSDTITATIGSVSGSATVNVTAPTLTSITVSPNPGSVRIGQTLTMTCIATYSDTSTGTCVSPSWSDTNAHSSINSSSGVVTGASVGSDTITATIASVSGSATVNVTAIPPPTLTSITVTPNPGTVQSGSALAMTCHAVYSDSTSGPCATPVWTDTNTHTTVNASTGVVTGGSTAGSDTITATIGSVHGNAIVNVTVTPPNPNPPITIVVGGVSITPAQGVTITNTNVINGHVAFTATTTQTTTAIATIIYKNTKLKYLSCGVMTNGEVDPQHGLAWAQGGPNTLTITALTALAPGIAVNIHVDCWTS